MFDRERYCFMKKQIQGIALILFGILLSVSDYSLNHTILSSFSDFPFALVGVATSVIGLVFVFKNTNDKN